MIPKYASGGIGDLLQLVESAIDAKSISVYSHYIKAPDIFAEFGVDVYRFDYFRSIEEMNSLFFHGEPLERKFFPQFTVPVAPIKRPDAKVVGIHIEGSKFSNDYWKSKGLPTKNMSEAFLLKLVRELQLKLPKAVIYLFCSPERRDEIGQLVAPHIQGDYYVIAFDKVWDSLACVAHCDWLIGMDSAIKTMSAILRIPTITLVGNYIDVYRDDHFLTPYTQEGVMSVINFHDIDVIPPERILQLMNI